MTGKVPEDLKNEPVFLALCEALRWWFYFDGPQIALCNDKEGRLSVDDVRRIAVAYNFGRNLSSEDEDVQALADIVNGLSGQSWPTLSERAKKLKPLIKEIQKKAGRRKIRMVSGTTKLSWFVAPENWTPFDRLAARAAGATKIDTMDRMLEFYKKLDGMGYLAASQAITRHLETAGLDEVRGEKVLDKRLMLSVQTDKSAESFRDVARGFGEALPKGLREQVFEVGRAIIADPACRIALPAISKNEAKGTTR